MEQRRRKHRQPWTTGDIDWLCDNAGKVPLPELCQHLGRSRSAVLTMACRCGVYVSNQDTTARLVWCNYCATWRTRIGEDGMCPVCRRKKQIEDLWEAQKKQEDLIRTAQDEERTQLDELNREANRIKKQTQRLRETTGMNPRKGGRNM